ncbi:Cytochrome d ubiquinol oxidase subunit X (EC 1.10.3.-), partial [Methylomonas fluvii]
CGISLGYSASVSRRPLPSSTPCGWNRCATSTIMASINRARAWRNAAKRGCH